MTDPNTYIEKETLRSWGQQMSRLNDEALEILEKINQEVDSLKEYWKGNAANGFTTVMKDLTATGATYHNKMKVTEKILNEVVNVAENQ